MADQVSGWLSPWLRRERIAAARPHLRGRVLDFGCGTGSLARYVAADAYLGVDIDEPSLAAARAEHPHHRFEATIPEDAHFDTIVALALIEHIADPVALLGRWRAMLVPDGHLVLTTPHPMFEWIHTIGARLRLFSPEASEEHETLIDEPKMRTLAGGAGLELQRGERFLWGANQLFLLGRRPNADA